MSVSSYRGCMFVSCVHPVEIFNAAFCMNCSLSMLVEDARGDRMEYITLTTSQVQEAIKQSKNTIHKVLTN